MNDQTRTAAAVDTLLALKREYLMPCVFHFYRKPMELVRGEDSRVFDTTGKAYVDCYADVGVTNCGHAEPGIVARAAAQLGTLAHTTFGGNPVCATAGLASLDFMREHRLEDVAARGPRGARDAPRVHQGSPRPRADARRRTRGADRRAGRRAAR